MRPDCLLDFAVGGIGVSRRATTMARTETRRAARCVVCAFPHRVAVTAPPPRAGCAECCSGLEVWASTVWRVFVLRSGSVAK